MNYHNSSIISILDEMIPNYYVSVINYPFVLLTTQIKNQITFSLIESRGNITEFAQLIHITLIGVRIIKILTNKIVYFVLVCLCKYIENI